MEADAEREKERERKKVRLSEKGKEKEVRRHTHSRTVISERKKSITTATKKLHSPLFYEFFLCFRVGFGHFTSFIHSTTAKKYVYHTYLSI